MNFNIAMNATNNFVNGIEKGLLPDEKKFLDDLVGVMDDALFEMRKDLDKQNNDRLGLYMKKGWEIVSV